MLDFFSLHSISYTINSRVIKCCFSGRVLRDAWSYFLFTFSVWVLVVLNLFLFTGIKAAVVTFTFRVLKTVLCPCHQRVTYTDAELFFSLSKIYQAKSVYCRQTGGSLFTLSYNLRANKGNKIITVWRAIATTQMPFLSDIF